MNINYHQWSIQKINYTFKKYKCNQYSTQIDYYKFHSLYSAVKFLHLQIKNYNTSRPIYPYIDIVQPVSYKKNKQKFLNLHIPIFKYSFYIMMMHVLYLISFRKRTYFQLSLSHTIIYSDFTNKHTIKKTYLYR